MNFHIEVIPKKYLSGLTQEPEKDYTEHFFNYILKNKTMKIELITIEQEFYGSILVDVSETDIIQIWNGYDTIPLERQNIQKLIDILTAKL